jgi:protein-S-isoprenylcysteine O-methyltransferase Ste14
MDDDAARAGARRWLLRETLGVAFVPVLLLWPAGRWDWTAAWVLTGIYAVWVAGTAVLVMPRYPALLAERATRRPERGWDKVILGSVGLLTTAGYLVAGFDVRYGWSPDMPVALQGAATFTALAAYGLVAASMASNAYFSTVSRIQADRGQAVATGGPYQVVRHPGYVGAAAFAVAAPFVLGSWAATPLGLTTGALLVVRTAFEDRMLRDELEGYADYAARVRWRLLPGIW